MVSAFETEELHHAQTVGCETKPNEPIELHIEVVTLCAAVINIPNLLL